MILREDFGNEQYKDQMMEIHGLVSVQVSRHLSDQEDRVHRETDDQRWLTEQGSQEALKVLDQLDWFLEKDQWKSYLVQHALLWKLLQELGLAPMLEETIRHRWGSAWLPPL